MQHFKPGLHLVSRNICLKKYLELVNKKILSFAPTSAEAAPDVEHNCNAALSRRDAAARAGSGRRHAVSRAMVARELR